MTGQFAPGECALHAGSGPTPRRECARDPVADVDPLRVDVEIGEHSRAPLEYWRERLRHPRRKPRMEPPDAPEPPHPPPQGSIDEYADAGRARGRRD